MTASVLPVPGIVLGTYPERRRDAPAWAPGLFSGARGAARYRPFVARVAQLAASLGPLDAAAIAGRLRPVRAAMARNGMSDDLVAEAFALVNRACAVTLGIELFKTQMLAARIMLDGRLAEMATGEGKTVAAGVCAATAALAGIPVHVITANDYLVARDAETLAPLYRALGLSTGAVTQSLAPAARARAYDCDIVYCTAAEVAFDYLRDGLSRERSRSDLQQRVAGLREGEPAPGRATLLRGLCMAIVDEADSILIDDARVPLVLSERRANDAERDYLGAALALARELTAGEHFVLNARQQAAKITPAGALALERLAQGLTSAWHNRAHREETVGTAIAALHLFARDRDYLVRDGAVTIIDAATGRLAPGRVWSRGLHTLVEIKEGCEPNDRTVTVAQITYQRFFQRYLALCGMSGTLAEARGELRSTYGLPVVRVPLRCPDRRTALLTRLFPDRASLWQAVVAAAAQTARAGRPVLIGTDSVADSEALSRCFAQENLPHAVLNARQDRAEAAIIARAGDAGRITVATNMAGRGTDIVLPAAVVARGGLHVICCQHNGSRRIDRQLLGRCARRGEPGSTQMLLSLDERLLARWVPRWVMRQVRKDGWEPAQRLARLIVGFAQWMEESGDRALRRDLLERDKRAAHRLAFGRPME